MIRIKLGNNNQDKDNNLSTQEGIFNNIQKVEKSDQIDETTSEVKKTILTVLEDVGQNKQNKGRWKATQMIPDKYGRERVGGVDIDLLYRPFDGRPMMFLKKLDIGNKLDITPIVVKDTAYEYNKNKMKGMIYRDKEGKFILLISRCGFFDKVTFDTYDDLEEEMKDIFGGEKNMQVEYQGLSFYHDRPVNKKNYIKDTEVPIPMNVEWDGLDIEAKKKALQGWGISLNFYGLKEIFDERSKKTFTIRMRDNDEGIIDSIKSLDKVAIEKVLSHPNIQKLKSAEVEIPLGRLEEICDLDKQTIDKIITIIKDVHLNVSVYHYDFTYFKLLDETSIYKASKLKIAGVTLGMSDIIKCGELSQNEILDAIKNDKINKLNQLGLSVLSIPEDIQILASMNYLLSQQDFTDKIKTITRGGLKLRLREIKSLLYIDNMNIFTGMKKNIGKGNMAFREIKKTKDNKKIQEFKEGIKKDTDITLSIIDDVTKALSENDIYITKRSESRSGYESKISNDILKKFVYPRIGDMDGEVQKTIVLTVAGYIGDCFSIERYMNSPEYKDNPENLLCAVRDIDSECITGKVTVEREGGSMVFYVEDELDYMKVYESNKNIVGEKGIYKDKDGKILLVSGGFSTSYSKIHQLINTVTVVNGSKEAKSSNDTKLHELRHSLDSRLMIATQGDNISQAVQKEILAYMTGGFTQERIQKILLNPVGLYAYSINTNSKEWESHTKKIERYLKEAFKAKEIGIDRYMNRLAITPINSWSMMF